MTGPPLAILVGVGLLVLIVWILRIPRRELLSTFGTSVLVITLLILSVWYLSRFPALWLRVFPPISPGTLP
jgi:energy-coupling factor transporter transmembrane protein EcfT